MKSAADCKLFRPAARLCGQLTEAIQMIPAARNHELTGTIIVDRINVREIGAKLLNRFIGKLKYCGHGARILLGGFLHQLPAAAYKRKTFVF